MYVLYVRNKCVFNQLLAFRIDMLTLTTPVTQERLNAAVVEVIGLNVMGPVCIPGEWDVQETINHVKVKLKHPCSMHYITDQGVMYQIKDKIIHFTRSDIYIFPSNEKN